MFKAKRPVRAEIKRKLSLPKLRARDPSIRLKQKVRTERAAKQIAKIALELLGERRVRMMRFHPSKADSGAQSDPSSTTFVDTDHERSVTSRMDYMQIP